MLFIVFFKNLFPPNTTLIIQCSSVKFNFLKLTYFSKNIYICKKYTRDSMDKKPNKKKHFIKN